MYVAEIMTQDVLTISNDDPLRKAAMLICLHRISGLPVVDSEGNLVGIISEKDILKAIYPTEAEFSEDPSAHLDFQVMEERYRDVGRVKVNEVMTHAVVTVSPDTALLRASSMMILNRIRRLPVVENGRLVGIISQGDIHQALFERYLLLAS